MGGFYTLKYIVYKKISAAAPGKIHFSDISLSLFPVGFRLRNIQDLPLKNENMVSFQAVNVVFPLRSFFSSQKTVIVEILRPLFFLNPSLFSMSSPGKGFLGEWNIRQVDILDGRIIYRSDNWDLQMLGFSLRSRMKSNGIAFKLDSPHLKLVFPVSKKRVVLEGAMEAEFGELPSHYKINRFLWHTKEITFSANGKAFKDGAVSLSTIVKGDLRDLLLPVLGEFTPAGTSSGSVQVTRNRSGNIWVNGNFTSPGFQIAQETLGDIKGRVNWNNQSEELRVEAQFHDKDYNSRLLLQSKDDTVGLQLANAAADTLTGMLKLKKDLPLAGRVEKGDIEITRNNITGTVLLNNGDFSAAVDSAFKLTGLVRFQKDKSTADVSFNAQRVLGNLGEFSISGTANGSRNLLDFQIDARIRDIEYVTPVTRFYLDLDLRPWNLQKGQGTFQLQYKKGNGQKHIHSSLQVDRFFANGQAIGSISGDLINDGRFTQGNFFLRDTDVNGSVEVEIGGGKTSFRFPDVQGESSKILKILNVGVNVSGKIAGDFKYLKSTSPSQQSVDGDFRSKQLFFENFPLDEISGHLHSNLQDLGLDHMDFFYCGGKGSGSLFIDFQKRIFDINGEIKELSIKPNWLNLLGKGSIIFRGKGLFFQDAVKVSFNFDPLFFYAGREFAARGEAFFYTDFGDFSLQSSGMLEYAPASSQFKLEINRQKKVYSGSFDLELKDLNLIIPWKNNVGQMRLMGQVVPGKEQASLLQGVASFSGDTLALPGFSHAINRFQGFLTFYGNEFRLQSFDGELGDGKLQGNGYVILQNHKLHDLLFNFIGREMTLYPMDRVQCRLNADLTLRTLNQQLLFQGNLNFLSVNWEREIDEPITFSTSSQLSSTESQILKMLQFDIRMIGDENILMSNSLGRIKSRFSLSLTGNSEFPIMTGTIDGKSGEVYFSDRAFNLLKAKVVFANKFFIDPLVQMESETDIQNYRIRFDIKGTSSRLKPEFSSSPPLPTQDILALISLGEMFKRSGSTEVSSELGSTAIISSKLTQEIKTRANRLLGIDMLRIDPSLSSQSSISAPWLTVGAGRFISKNLILVYSTNLSTSKQQILYFQYQLSPTISVIGMKDEEGKYSVDIRYRKRR